MLNKRKAFRDIATKRTGACPYHFEATGFWKQTLDRWQKEGHLKKGENAWEHFDIYPYMNTSHPSIVRLTDKVLYPSYYPRFEEKLLEDDGEHIIRMEEDGIIKKQTKDLMSFPQFLKFPVESREDWEKLKEKLNPEDEGRYVGVKEAAKEINNRDHIMRFGVCGCYGTLRGLYGEEKLAYVYYDDPELLHDIMKTWLNLYTKMADRLCPHLKYDYVFFWEDMAYKNGPLISPDLFKEFMLPYYKAFTAHMKKHGIDLFMVDSDGNNFVIMDLFLEGGINMFLPCEIAAGMEPQLVREKYPDLVIMGGIDKRAVIAGPEETRREIDRKVPELVKKGRYIPFLDHHIPPDVSYDNFRFYLDYLRKIEY